MKLLKAMKKKEDFSDTEQNIIEYVFNNAKAVGDLSIRELAEKTYTSSAAIFRLCQKLGLKGYTEFKIKFISEFNRTESYTTTEQKITCQDDVMSVVRKIACLQVEAIEESKNELDPVQLTRLVGLLDRAAQIDFYAFDNNVNIAQTTSWCFMNIGKAATADPSTNIQIMRALSAPQTHVAILLSRTGENKRLIKIAQILKKRQIKSILFTTERGSPLVALCDEFIYVANTEEFLDMGVFIFNAGVQYLMNVLVGLLISHNYEHAVKMVDAFESINGKTSDKERLW